MTHVVLKLGHGLFHSQHPPPCFLAAAPSGFNLAYSEEGRSEQGGGGLGNRAICEERDLSDQMLGFLDKRMCTLQVLPNDLQ